MSVFSSPDGLLCFAGQKCPTTKRFAAQTAQSTIRAPFLSWHWAVLVTHSNGNIYQMFQSLPSAIWFLPGSCQTPLGGFGTREGMPALSSPLSLSPAHIPWHKGGLVSINLDGTPAVPRAVLGAITKLLPREKLLLSDTCEQSGAISHLTPTLMMLPSVIITYFFIKPSVKLNLTGH